MLDPLSVSIEDEEEEEECVVSGLRPKLPWQTPDSAEIGPRLVTLGARLAESGRLEEALEVFEAARLLNPSDADLVMQVNRMHRRAIPRWHFAMLNDEERNDAFRRALSAALGRNSVVLDVGTGSGLLAMMAVRLGAKAAYSCEMLGPVARMARRIVAANGLADRIAIIGKRSSDLVIGQDVPELADVLVTETLDCGLLGEGLLPIVRHARRHLLRPGARIIPSSAVISFSLLESEDVHRNNFASTVRDLDVSLFNHFSSLEYFPVRLGTWGHRLLSEPSRIFDFDFQAGPLEPEERRVTVDVREGGLVHGVVFWFDADLGDGIRLTNAPQNPRSHWMQAVQCFETPVPVEPGRKLTVRASHDTTSITFELV
jgi:type II protein arginine methyltransferase